MVKREQVLTLMSTSCTRLKLRTRVLHQEFQKTSKIRRSFSTIRKSSTGIAPVPEPNWKQLRKHSMERKARQTTNLWWTRILSTSSALKQYSITSLTTEVTTLQRRVLSSSLMLTSSMQLTTEDSTKNNQWRRKDNGTRKRLQTSMARSMWHLTRDLKEAQYSRPMRLRFMSKHHRRLGNQRFISRRKTARLSKIRMQESRCSTIDAYESMTRTWREILSSERTWEDSGAWRATPRQASQALLHRNWTSLFRNKLIWVMLRKT